MDNVKEFTQKKSISFTAKPMYRVIDITSPFFIWEGWLHDTIPMNDPEFIQIICAHNGFQFPALTFNKLQVIEIPNSLSKEKK